MIDEAPVKIQNLSSATDFCPLCGNILQLPAISDLVECNRCSYSCSTLEYQVRPITTYINFDEKKQWLEHYCMHRDNKVFDEVIDDNNTRSTIKQECPKCGFDLMLFWTVQMRSADEGSTVFYECVKCKFRCQQNN